MYMSYTWITRRRLIQCHIMSFSINFGNMALLWISGCGSELTYPQERSVLEMLSVVSGVPQGSILGPLLFVLYINDLPHIVSSTKPYLFAEDTKCLHISPPESDDNILLQNDIDNLTTYSNSWHLHFNKTKCVHLHFQFNSTSYIPKYYINNKEICRKVKTKDLGFIFNTGLHLDQHHRIIISRAYRCLYL